MLEVGSTQRRLIQDFVTVAVPMDAVVGRLEREPSPLPHLLESAARPTGLQSAPEPHPARDVLVLTTRPRNEGWSTGLSWPLPLHDLPPFDGELVLQGIPADRTWIGLEGAVSLLVGQVWSERALRDAQVRFRSMLVNLSAQFAVRED